MSTPAHPLRIGIVCRLGDAPSKAAAAFVAQLSLEPVLFTEPPAGGGVASFKRLDGLRGLDYAIVMLSAADLAGERGGTLMEIGFVLGAVGAGRTCLVLGGQAAPAAVPELEGVARHGMDDGGLWRLLLAREMRQAGLDVDMNRAL
jgi:hypothetical protein